MIILIFLDSQIYTAIYFLLCQLSLMDLFNSFTFVPKIATDFLSGKNTISFTNCRISSSSSGWLVEQNVLFRWSWLMTTMQHICHPLRYSVLKHPMVYVFMVAGTCLIVLLNAFVHVICTLNLPYCDSWEIHHCFVRFQLSRKLFVLKHLSTKLLFVSRVMFPLIPIAAIIISLTDILYYFEIKVKFREEKGFGNLFFPCDCGDFLPCNSLHHVLSP